MKRVFQVTGLQFHGYKKVADALKPGVSVELVRDPRNKYDVNAISVQYGDTQVGWIPKVCNADLAALLDDGKQYTATVVSNEAKYSSRNPMGLYIEVVVL